MPRRRSISMLLLVGVLFLVLGTLSTVYALRFAGGERIVIEPDEVIADDLYITAREVIIRGTVEGDVYAAAQRVIVDSGARITGDLVVGAQVVDIQGIVEDDIRAAGQVIRVAAPEVGDDVMTACFSMEVAEGSTVGGSLLVGAYQVAVNGNVREDVYAGANGMAIYGSVGGDVKASVGESGGPPPALWASFMTPDDVAIPAVPAGLTVGDGARIAGNLIYVSVQDAIISPGARIEGQIDHRLPPPSTQETQPPQFGSMPWAIEQFRRWLTLLLTSAVLFLTLPTQSRQVGTTIARKPLASLGWGIVFVATLIASLIGLIIVGGLVALMFSLVTLSQLAKWTIVIALATDILLVIAYLAYVNLVAPIFVPYALLHKLDRGTWWWLPPVVLGTLLYVMLTSLPYVGWLFSLLVVLVGVGALVVMYRSQRNLVLTKTDS